MDEYTVNPIVFLANGVTSTFPAGEVDPEGMMAARRRIERGEQIGPRIHSSGPYFGTARPGWRNADWTPERIRAGSGRLGGERRARLQGQGHPAAISCPRSSIRRTATG